MRAEPKARGPTSQGYFWQDQGVQTDAFDLSRKDTRERTSKELAGQFGAVHERTLSKS
jgi:hypothetical protein